MPLIVCPLTLLQRRGKDIKKRGFAPLFDPPDYYISWEWFSSSD